MRVLLVPRRNSHLTPCEHPRSHLIPVEYTPDTVASSAQVLSPKKTKGLCETLHIDHESYCNRLWPPGAIWCVCATSVKHLKKALFTHRPRLRVSSYKIRGLGSGDVIPELKQLVKQYNLEHSVIFKGRMPYDKMMAHTRVADLGLSLDKDTNVNYRFSLPNKLFDYIHAGIPVLGSDLVEVKRIIENYRVGEIAVSFEPEKLAAQIQEMLLSPEVKEWRRNALKARAELNWETETKVLSTMIDNLNG